MLDRPNLPKLKIPKAVLQWFGALVVGIGFGFLAWGEPSHRKEGEYIQSLGAVLGDVREQNRLMQELLAGDESKSRTSLAICEKAQVKLQTDLEQCLFANAQELHDAIEESGDAGFPRSGLVPFAETRTYPVPLPEK